jgi:hypothetical protein
VKNGRAKAEHTAGFFYVTAVDGSRVARIMGPFDTHERALAEVGICMDLMDRLDPRGWFWAWGTTRYETDRGPGYLMITARSG